MKSNEEDQVLSIQNPNVLPVRILYLRLKREAVSFASTVPTLSDDYTPFVYPLCHFTNT